MKNKLDHFGILLRFDKCDIIDLVYISKIWIIWVGQNVLLIVITIISNVCINVINFIMVLKIFVLL